MDFMQTTQVLGNLGEFIGSLAVLATLVYLAIQVHHGKALLQQQNVSMEQANRVAISTAEAEMLYRNIDYFRSIVDNQHVAELYAKLRKGDELTDVEKQQGYAMTQQLFQLWVSSNTYHKNGLIDDSTHEMMIQTPEAVINSMPGLRKFLLVLISNPNNPYAQSNDAQQVMSRIRLGLTNHGYFDKSAG